MKLSTLVLSCWPIFGALASPQAGNNNVAKAVSVMRDPRYTAQAHKYCCSAAGPRTITKTVIPRSTVTTTIVTRETVATRRTTIVKTATVFDDEGNQQRKERRDLVPRATVAPPAPLKNYRKADLVAACRRKGGNYAECPNVTKTVTNFRKATTTTTTATATKFATRVIKTTTTTTTTSLNPLGSGVSQLVKNPSFEKSFSDYSPWKILPYNGFENHNNYLVIDTQQDPLVGGNAYSFLFFAAYQNGEFNRAQLYQNLDYPTFDDGGYYTASVDVYLPLEIKSEATIELLAAGGTIYLSKPLKELPVGQWVRLTRRGIPFDMTSSLVVGYTGVTPEDGELLIIDVVRVVGPVYD